MSRFSLRRSLGCCSLLAFSLGAWQGREPIAAAANDPAAPAAWCSQVQGGPPSTQSPLLALSALHAATRLFGVGASFQATDRALAKAMARPFAGDPRILRDYVAAIGDGEECVARASSTTLGPARVEMVGDVAVVHPGTGTLSLPAGAKAVAIDVRGLPTNAPDFLGFALAGVPNDPVRDALDAAVALALAAPVQRPVTTLRLMNGLPDGDVEEPDYSWGNFLVPWQFEAYPAGSQTELPLAVLTGKALAPAAAEMAAALRLANRAWLFGEDVQVRVAESTWSPLADQGIMLRDQDLSDPVSGARWPDAVPADARGGNPVELAAGLAELGMPPAATPGAATRPPIVVADNFYDPQPDTLGPGEARAGLVSVHGAVRYFYALFADAGDHIDPALGAAMGAVDLAALGGGPIDRDFYFATLRRFGRSLNDGHNFNFDQAKPFTGFLPLNMTELNGEPVVRRSGLANVHPGDTIVGIDGVPASAWYAAQLALTSAATDRYRFNLVTRKVLLRVYGPRTFDLRAPDGSIRREIAQPIPYAGEAAFGTAPNDRPSGFLTDMGAPDVFYLNMAFEVTPNENAGLAAIAEAQGARAMVVDMRGYPHGNHYFVAGGLMPDGFFYPEFGGITAFAPGQSYLFENGPFNDYFPPIAEFFPPDAPPPTYTGPIVLMVGTDTVSAAENFSLMLVDNQRALHVVGRPTAGTNGEITGMEVLGHYSFSFTGLDVHHADGSRFIGLGITPDIPVVPTQQQIADGEDPELTAAIAALGP